MRILHTSDWHLGKIVHGVHMTEQQEVVLEQMLEDLDRYRVDALVVAGDIYDRSVPPVEAVDLFNRTLTRVLRQTPVQKVFMISGNHDSPERIGYGSGLFDALGLHIGGKYEGDIRTVDWEDSSGPVRFHLFPFEIPQVIRARLEDPEIRDYEDAWRAQMAAHAGRMDPGMRHVLVAHGFVSGSGEALTSESERQLSIGGTERISADVLKDFDYCALGHLHRAQQSAEGRVRYPGSLMRYSFSELDQENGGLLVELGPDGVAYTEKLSWKPRWELRRLTGSLEELLNPSMDKAQREHYYQIVLTDKGALYDPISRLKAVYPNLLRLEREGFGPAVLPGQQDPDPDVEEISGDRMIRTFFSSVREEPLTDSQEAILEDLYARLTRGEGGDVL